MSPALHTRLVCGTLPLCLHTQGEIGRYVPTSHTQELEPVRLAEQCSQLVDQRFGLLVAEVSNAGHMLVVTMPNNHFLQHFHSGTLGFTLGTGRPYWRCGSDSFGFTWGCENF